jgi:hypothetical protein
VHLCRTSHRPTAVVLPRPVGISLGRSRPCTIRRTARSPDRRLTDRAAHTRAPSARRTHLCELIAAVARIFQC